MISEVDIEDMKPDDLKKKEWSERFVARMISYGFDEEFATKCAQANIVHYHTHSPEEAALEEILNF